MTGPRVTDTGLPRRAPYPHPTASTQRLQPTNDEIEHAQAVYDQHLPTLTQLNTCIAEACGTWPCQPSRDAELVLRAGGRLPVAWVPASAPARTC